MPEFVNVKNRSSREIEGCFDGRSYAWAPGETKTLPYNVAELCKRQNPVMGTEDINDLTSSDYLLAIVEDGDDASPQEQSDALERFDRDTIGIDAKQETVTINLKSKTKKSRRSVAADIPNISGLQATYDD